MFSFVKKSIYWLGFYFVLAALILYFVVYDRDPNSFLRLWGPTQTAVFFAGILTTLTSVSLYYSVAREAAIDACRTEGKTYYYGSVMQISMMARAAAVSYWIAAIPIAATDFIAKWCYERDLQYTQQAYIESAPIFNMGTTHYIVILLGGLFLAVVAGIYAIKLKYFIKV